MTVRRSPPRPNTSRPAVRHPGSRADQEAAVLLPRQRTAGRARTRIRAQDARTHRRGGRHLLRLPAGVPARAEIRARRRHPRRRLRLHRPLHPALRPRHRRRDPRATRRGRGHGDQHRAHPEATGPSSCRASAVSTTPSSPCPTWCSRSTSRCSPRSNTVRRPTTHSPPARSIAWCRASPSIR